MKYDKQITKLIDKYRGISFENVSVKEKIKKKYNEQINQLWILQAKDSDEIRIRKGV